MNKNIDAEFNLPPQITIDQYDDYMHIRRKWRGFQTIMMAISAVVWFVIVAVMYFENVEAVYNNMGFMLFILGFAVLGVFQIYLTLAFWLNKTDIFISTDLMEIKIGPVPWYGNKKLKTLGIKQFFTKKKISGSREKRSVSFEVHYIDAEGQDKKLVTGLPFSQHAELIERKIEQYLGIKDDPNVG